MVFKHIFDFRPGCLATRDVDPVGGSRSNVNHFLELRVFKSLYRLVGGYEPLLA
jgi:hypothetical protein